MTDNNETNLNFKILDRAGVKTLVAWAQSEGWNPGLSDAELFYAADPEGFLGCFLDDQMVGGGSIVSYEGNFGFMGLFIVKPEFRGSGIGAQLWDTRKRILLSRLKKGAAIGMDGVVAMQPFYNRGGFETSFRDERYERTGEVFESNPNVSPYTTKNLTAILDYDFQCMGFNRKRFLMPWIEQPQGQTLTYEINQELQGFAVIRKCHVGFKIGPLFADYDSVAEALYKACLTFGKGEPVFIDIPMNNESAIALVKKYQAQYVFECARMYLGIPPKTQMSKVFGITSFELG